MFHNYKIFLEKEMAFFLLFILECIILFLFFYIFEHFVVIYLQIFKHFQCILDRFLMRINPCFNVLFFVRTPTLLAHQSNFVRNVYRI